MLSRVLDSGGRIDDKRTQEVPQMLVHCLHLNEGELIHAQQLMPWRPKNCTTLRRRLRLSRAVEQAWQLVQQVKAGHRLLSDPISKRGAALCG